MGSWDGGMERRAKVSERVWLEFLSAGMAAIHDPALRGGMGVFRVAVRAEWIWGRKAA